MSKKLRNKRKARNSSGSNSDSTDSTNQCKVFKPRGPSEETEKCLSVSDVLGQANAVLYEDTKEDNNDSNQDCLDNSVFVPKEYSSGELEAKMAEGGKTEPTLRDVMDCMKGMSERLATMERKLGAIESLERKVVDFEKELKKVWVALEDRVKRTDERVAKLEDRVDATDIVVGIVDSRVADLEKRRQQLSDDVSYLKAQSMRNNLLFTGIEEDSSSGNDPPTVTERKLREHLMQKKKVARETAEAILLERVHRTPSQPVRGKVRTIVAKFTFVRTARQ